MTGNVLASQTQYPTHIVPCLSGRLEGNVKLSGSNSERQCLHSFDLRDDLAVIPDNRCTVRATLAWPQIFRWLRNTPYLFRHCLMTRHRRVQLLDYLFAKFAPPPPPLGGASFSWFLVGRQQAGFALIFQPFPKRRFFLTARSFLRAKT